jgi:predicted Fe-Mo cluster-binding NifX family protein
MEKIIAAFATDDGTTFMDRHFGDAGQYVIYEIYADDSRLIKAIGNTTEEEQQHADPNKAQGVTGLFKHDKVQVLVSKKFGGNINRMKKKFLCILMNDESIRQSIVRIQENFDSVSRELKKGEERHFLNFKE